VDDIGRELAVICAHSDGAELSFVQSKKCRRWKLEWEKDIYQVNKKGCQPGSLSITFSKITLSRYAFAALAARTVF
jgi:hypothetical protein